MIEDGVRESIQSWREVLLKLKPRGMNVPELTVVGDGAMGFSLHGTTFNQRSLVDPPPSGGRGESVELSGNRRDSGAGTRG